MAPVLVLGSTGHVGNATINALVARGVATRAGTRDPSSEKAVALAALAGVEVVKADMGKDAAGSPGMIKPALTS